MRYPVIGNLTHGSYLTIWLDNCCLLRANRLHQCIYILYGVPGGKDNAQHSSLRMITRMELQSRQEAQPP
jgi:hypothetical protein